MICLLFVSGFMKGRYHNSSLWSERWKWNQWHYLCVCMQSKFWVFVNRNNECNSMQMWVSNLFKFVVWNWVSSIGMNKNIHKSMFLPQQKCQASLVWGRSYVACTNHISTCRCFVSMWWYIVRHRNHFICNRTFFYVQSILYGCLVPKSFWNIGYEIVFIAPGNFYYPRKFLC